MSNASVWPRVVGLLALGAVVGLGAGALSAQGSDEPPAGRPAASAAPGDGGTPAPGQDATAPEEPEDGAATLEASTESVGADQRFELSGTFPGAEPGTELRVQRRLDGGDWTDFPEGDPVTADVGEDGAFAVQVASGRPGPNEWRVQDPGTGATSEPVVVTVG